MDENENRLSADQEFHVPDSAAEYSLPKPETEFAALRREADEAEKKPSRVRRLIRYTAAAAVSLGLLAETAPAPLPEAEEIPSAIVIDCAAVRPEEPETLYFEYHFTGLSGMRIAQSQRILTDAQGRETELQAEHDPLLYRSVYIPRESSDRSRTQYRLFYRSEEASDYLSGHDDIQMGNESIHMFRAHMPSRTNDGQLKLVVLLEDGDTLKKMTSSAPVTLLPPEGERSMTLQAAPSGDGLVEASLRAVYSPQPGDGHIYEFQTESLCTRWYDAAGAFLREGWYDALYYRTGPLEDLLKPRREGRDYVFSYEGTIHAGAEDPAAAFYSVELHVVDNATGWHYLFESNQLPVTE